MDIFNNVSYIFDNIDGILRNFYIVVFVIILFIFVIRFIL